jgi:exonuclease III
MYLRVLTYNIHGLRNHLSEVLQMITEYNIDILLLQETWIKYNETTIDIDTRLANMGWQCWWYNNSRSQRQYNNKKQGGVAIWIKTTSSRRPEISMENIITKVAGGRFMSIQLKWAGHKLQIGCAYLPNRQSETFKIIEKHLLGVAEKAVQDNRQILWAGDWNFVEDLIQDTSSEHRQKNVNEQYTVSQWQQLMSMLVECNGQELRSQKAYTAKFNTRHGWVGSRLDRFYSSETLQPFTKTVRVLNNITFSDHKPVLLELRGRTFPNTMKWSSTKLPRVKMSFRTDQTMVELARTELTQWLSTIPEQLQEDSIIENWDKVKHKLTVISNWYSSKLEKETKQILANLHSQQNDEVTQHQKRVLQNQLMQANQSDPKLIIKNDQVDRTFHKFLKGNKKVENIPPLNHPRYDILNMYIFKHYTYRILKVNVKTIQTLCHRV